MIAKQAIKFMRSDNTLAVLTESQLDDLYDWLNSSSIIEVQKRLLEPSPVGFGLKVHRNTLSRFYQDRSREERAQLLAELESSPQDPNHALTFFNASDTALAHFTCAQAHAPLHLDSYNTLARAVHKYRADLLRQGFLGVAREQVAIARERLAIEREFLAEKKRQFNVNVAAEASIHAHEIKEVYRNRDGDLQQKLNQVSNIIFGPPPEPHSNQPQNSQ